MYALQSISAFASTWQNVKSFPWYPDLLNLGRAKQKDI
jgi:hypothetical protein